jgi:hypothetical protein
MSKRSLLVNKNTCSIQSLIETSLSYGEKFRGTEYIVRFEGNDQKYASSSEDFGTTNENFTYFILNLIQKNTFSREFLNHIVWCDFLVHPCPIRLDVFPLSSSTLSMNDSFSNRCDYIPQKYIALNLRNSIFLFGETEEHVIKLGFMPEDIRAFHIKGAKGYISAGLLIIGCDTSSRQNSIHNIGKNKTTNSLFTLTHPLELPRSLWIPSEDLSSLDKISSNLDFCESFADIIVMFDTSKSVLYFFRIFPNVNQLKFNQISNCSKSRTRISNAIPSRIDNSSETVVVEYSSSKIKNLLPYGDLKSKLTYSSHKNCHASNYNRSICIKLLNNADPKEFHYPELLMRRSKFYLDAQVIPYESFACNSKPRVRILENDFLIQIDMNKEIHTVRLES